MSDLTRIRAEAAAKRARFMESIRLVREDLSPRNLLRRLFGSVRRRGKAQTVQLVETVREKPLVPIVVAAATLGFVGMTLFHKLRSRDAGDRAGVQRGARNSKQPR